MSSGYKRKLEKTRKSDKIKINQSLENSSKYLMFSYYQMKFYFLFYFFHKPWKEKSVYTLRIIEKRNVFEEQPL